MVEEHCALILLAASLVAALALWCSSIMLQALGSPVLTLLPALLLGRAIASGTPYCTNRVTRLVGSGAWCCSCRMVLWEYAQWFRCTFPVSQVFSFDIVPLGVL